MTRNVIIDRDAALNLIDELRVAVPEEVRAAKRINQEGERIIEKAQEEAERIVARAQEQAAFLIDERGLTEAAEDGEPADHRHRRGGRRRRPAPARTTTPPACSPGSRPTSTRTLRSIERGIAMLDERRAAHDAAAPGRGRYDAGRPARAAADWSKTRRRPRPSGGDDLVRHPRAAPVDTNGDPLTFALSGPDGRGAGHRPRVRDRRASTSTRATAWSSPSPSSGTMRLSRTNRGLRRRRPADHRPRRGVRALPAAGRDAGRRCGSTRRCCPSIDLAQRPAGPARGGRGPRGAAPHRPPRAGAATAGDRGDQHQGADRPAVRARLPGPVPGVRRAARARPRARRRRHRPAARGAAGLPGRRPTTRAGRLPARPQDPAVARARALAPGAGSITRPRRGRAPA